jgi:hypothetical protein
MFRKTLMTTALGSAILIAGPALAQAPGGRSGGSNANSGARVSTQAPTNVNVNANANVNAHANAALKSQGPANASVNGIAHANSNSVLARGAVSAASLPGLTTGLTVQNSAGVSVGTVSQVVTASDGSIRAVIVTSPTGQTLRLPPSSLSISGSVVTTTSTTVGG